MVPSRDPSKLPRTYTVAFETWTQKTTDVLRVKRLLIGAGVGLAMVFGGIAFVVLTSSQAAAETEEEDAKVVEVQLAKEPEPEPEPPPPPPPVLPKVIKPVPVSEGMTPPEAIVKLVKPEYPADAKAAGLEGTVVVRYVVNEQGEVTDVRAMKGPTELYAVCVAAVKAMRFKPALDADGKPVMVVRYMKFPFKLRT